MSGVAFVSGASARMTLALVVTVTGCYSPDLRDCAVTCAVESECPDGQTCSLGYCVAGSAIDCQHPTTALDAGPPVPPRTALHVTIAGHGRIQIEGGMTCSSESPQNGDCTISLPRNVAVTLHAIEIDDDDHAFERWTTIPCLGDEAPTCQFTPSVPTLNLGAKFK